MENNFVNTNSYPNKLNEETLKKENSLIHVSSDQYKKFRLKKKSKKLKERWKN